MVISKHKLGIWSEYLAILFLRLKFYDIISTRYKTYLGEIDIIARKGNTIVFVEVKARRNLNLHYEVVTKNQINRIKRAAVSYMSSRRCYKTSDIRFDLIVISKLVSINHIKNAW